MSNHKNPFTNIVIDKDHPHAEIEFTCDGVLAKATFNATSAVGRLSRGTVALMDPSTKRLLQKDPQSKTHKFSDAICKQFIVPLPKASQKQEDVILAIATKKFTNLSVKTVRGLRFSVCPSKTLVASQYSKCWMIICRIIWQTGQQAIGSAQHTVINFKI